MSFHWVALGLQPWARPRSLSGLFVGAEDQGADLLVDTTTQIRLFFERVRTRSRLAEPLSSVAVPGARLLHHAHVYRLVDQVTHGADALAMGMSNSIFLKGSATFFATLMRVRLIVTALDGADAAHVDALRA